MSRQKKVIRYKVLAPVLLLIMATGIWYGQVGNLSNYLAGAAPPGQTLYVFSRLFGLLALTAIGWQLIASLLEKSGLVAKGWLQSGHVFWGIGILIFSLAHALLFFGAVSLRQNSLALNLWLPNFTDFYHSRLSLGLLALVILTLVAIAGALRRRSFAKYVHRMYLVGSGLVFFHALAVGSDSQTFLGLLFFGSIAGVVVLASLVLLTKLIFERGQQHETL